MSAPSPKRGFILRDGLPTLGISCFAGAHACSFTTLITAQREGPTQENHYVNVRGVLPFWCILAQRPAATSLRAALPRPAATYRSAFWI